MLRVNDYNVIVEKVTVENNDDVQKVILND